MKNDDNSRGMKKKRLPKNVRERNGKYHYRYDITDPVTGNRKQKETRGFATAKEAEREGIRIEAEKLNGTYIEGKDTTFDTVAEDWLVVYQNTGKVKISTVRVRKHEIGRLSKYFGKLKLKDISKKCYQNALNELHKEGYADNTIDGVHRTGRMIFKWAVEMDIIKTDPTQYAIVPRVQQTVEELEGDKEIPKYLEKEELALFLSAANENGYERDYPIFLTLSYTGMRAGELCALKWSDINFEDLTIRITKTYYNPTNNTKEYTLLTPKTKTSRRVIDIDKSVIDELELLQKNQKIVQMRYRKTYHNKGFVFAQQSEKYAGYPIYIKLIENRMNRLLKLTDLNTSLTPHSLRHTHTSLLAEAGVSLEQIMARLGHSDDETTKNIYLHVTKPRKKEASHKFAELMRSI